MPINTSTNLYDYSKYIVGGGSPYTTVQSAINAANAAGGGTVVLRPGLYTENLTLYSLVDIEGTTGSTAISNVTIHGVHTPPAAGTIAFRDVALSSATHIFNSAVAGTALIAMENCSVNCINGYVFNLPNWAGSIFVNNLLTLSTDDGFCNLTSTATVQATNSSIGSGTANPMIISNQASFFGCSILPPQTYQTSAIVSFKSCAIGYTATYSDNATAAYADTNFSTGAQIAITTTSANPVTLGNVIINSSAVNVITGTGEIKIGNVSFENGKNIQSTVTQTYLSAVDRISNYTVGSTGNFSTIQSALNVANANGGGTIYVQPGTYTENLILYDNTQIVGALGFSDIGNLIIIGKHTPPATGGFVFRNVTLQSATHIFDSAVAGSAHLIIGDAAINVTNGYTFNLPNWTGKLEVFDVNDRGSTNDGFVNNTGGAEVAIFTSAIGDGNANTMIVTGVTSIFTCSVGCPIEARTGASLFLEGNVHLNTVTFNNNSTGDIAYSEFITTGAAIVMNSSGGVSISDTSINTANNPAIDGTSVGALTIGSITYLNNNTIAATVTKSFTTRLETGVLKIDTAKTGPLSANAGVIDTQPLTNGQLLIGNTGSVPTAAGLTPGAGIAITSGAGSITISAWGGGLSWTTKGASTALVVNNGFICTAGAGLSFSLPVTSSVGDVVALTLDGSTSWTITQGAGQQIRLGSSQTTLGVGGSLVSTAQGDTIYLVCSVANLKWNATSVIGNITVN